MSDVCRGPVLNAWSNRQLRH